MSSVKGVLNRLIHLTILPSLPIALLAGCAYTQPLPSTHGPVEILQSVIHSTDWISSLLLIGVVLGVFTGMNGLKVGWMGVVASTVGLLVKSALSVTWVYWWCGFTLVAVMLAAVASIILKNHALREIITGVQDVKSAVGPELDKGAVNETLAAAQSKTTKRLVHKHKVILYDKGKI
jgi:hypothetical protein